MVMTKLAIKCHYFCYSCTLPSLVSMHMLKMLSLCYILTLYLFTFFLFACLLEKWLMLVKILCTKQVLSTGSKLCKGVMAFQGR